MVQECWLGLGGNVGDVIASFAGGLQRLNASDGIKVSAVSRVYKTPPWGKTDQDWFYNCCAGVECSLPPEALLDLCLETEKSFQRERGERWGPRTLDIDVLAFGGEVICTERLTVPHARMLERAFVLTPLTEIAPDLKINGLSVKSWSDGVQDDSMEPIKLASDWWKQPGQGG
ncbi:MAG: 2-amino-4-hydroxy-6-hydroxymethyldihydropteridine diphosphokinase [Pseudomonadota bacterium]